FDPLFQFRVGAIKDERLSDDADERRPRLVGERAGRRLRGDRGPRKDTRLHQLVAIQRLRHSLRKPRRQPLAPDVNQWLHSLGQPAQEGKLSVAKRGPLSHRRRHEPGEERAGGDVQTETGWTRPLRIPLRLCQRRTAMTLRRIWITGPVAEAALEPL